ncbi:MAG: TIM barrel protein, partial [Devosiaceae bacterium]|nr:TIM barrel protein [Devosiaceae bacterium MH13]
MDEQPSPSVSDPASALTRRGFAGLALHSWTVDALSLEEVLQLAAETGFDAVELRYVDFARALASQSEADLIAAVKVAGVPVCALGVVYGWIYATGAEQENLFEAFKRSCERAAKLGCPTLMTGAGAGEGSVTQAADALARAGEIAGGFDLS